MEGRAEVKANAILEDLNPGYEETVLLARGSLLVLVGAGLEKTRRMITRRVFYLIGYCRPDSVEVRCNAKQPRHFVGEQSFSISSSHKHHDRANTLVINPSGPTAITHA
jgi:hypothetical protein